jgi:hypothetical protein
MAFLESDACLLFYSLPSVIRGTSVCFPLKEERFLCKKKFFIPENFSRKLWNWRYLVIHKPIIRGMQEDSYFESLPLDITLSHFYLPPTLRVCFPDVHLNVIFPLRSHITSAQLHCITTYSVVCFKEYARLAATRVLDWDINEFSQMESVSDHCRLYNTYMHFCIYVIIICNTRVMLVFRPGINFNYQNYVDSFSAAFQGYLASYVVCINFTV